MNLIDGVKKEETDRKLKEYKKRHNKDIVAAKVRHDEVKGRMELLIKVENARLKHDYYQRMQMEQDISEEDKERAEKLI